MKKKTILDSENEQQRMTVLPIAFVSDCSIIMYHCVSLTLGSSNHDVSRLLESFLKAERGEGHDCL